MLITRFRAPILLAPYILLRTNLCIGRNVDQASRDWYGWIDDVRLYNKVLSDAEMESIAGTSYTISGTVGTLDGVTMNGLPGNPVTSGGGNYSATVDYGWDGTVTPAKTGYTFTPASITYSNVISNQTVKIIHRQCRLIRLAVRSARLMML